MKLSDIVTADGVRLCEHESNVIHILPDDLGERSPKAVKGFSLAFMEESPARVMMSTHSKWWTPEEVAARVFVSAKKCAIRIAEITGQAAHDRLLQAASMPD